MAPSRPSPSKDSEQDKLAEKAEAAFVRLVRGNGNKCEFHSFHQAIEISGVPLPNGSRIRSYYHPDEANWIVWVRNILSRTSVGGPGLDVDCEDYREVRNSTMFAERILNVQTEIEQKNGLQARGTRAFLTMSQEFRHLMFRRHRKECVRCAEHSPDERMGFSLFLYSWYFDPDDTEPLEWSMEQLNKILRLLQYWQLCAKQEEITLTDVEAALFRNLTLQLVQEFN